MSANRTTPNMPTAAARVRICLLYKKNIQSATTGSIKCIAKFAPALAEFVTSCSSEDGPLNFSNFDVEAAIHDVIQRSTKGGNSNRSILVMCKNTNDWVVTITPIFPTGAAR